MMTSRRSLLGLRFGAITATQEAPTVRVLQVRLSPLELHDNAVLVQSYGMASSPLPGCTGLVVNVGGEQSPQDVIIATNDQRYHFSLSPGEVALHTDEGDHVWFRRGRIIDVLAGTAINVVAPQVHITGHVLISGDLLVTGDIADRNGAHSTLGALREAYNAHEHPVPHVQPGSATLPTGTTDHPVP